MKKLLTLVFLSLFCAVGGAQNVQFHYDFGKTLYDKDFGTRPQLTTTVEMFKPDKWGSTFFFVDMDYTGKGVVGAYWEIARELSFWKSPLSIHVEYNGGNVKGNYINNAYLGGVTYSYNNATYSKGFTFTPMYKYIHGNDSPHNFQITGTWYLHFGKNGLCTFSGFADFWREKTLPSIGDYQFLAEPQIWVNLNKIKGVDEKFNLSIGSEVELRNNFAFVDGFFAIPTLAIKWSFD
ncbi:nucleoside-specific channel-forming Tsx family protein [Massilibacteroides vaginae]|uniref:nucleoside-specific channel-forming Tsx family protein n=1 Tax=Massilibacteroides vaginae TaxID=1673718 RepID=UPI000A1CBECD|nr:DUF5020 family protein [Massilibacteroides vaginae]